MLNNKEFQGMIKGLSQKQEEQVDARRIDQDDRLVAKLFAEVCCLCVCRYGKEQQILSYSYLKAKAVKNMAHPR